MTFRLASILGMMSIWALVSRAQTTVWGMNASFGNPHIQAYDLATGVALADFTAPHKDANRGRANGRGIAVVGTTIYYTLADTPNVYKTDTATHADLGIAFTTPLSPGINSLAWDGASFWLLASQPTDPTRPADDNVYQYSSSGKLLQTLVLARPSNTNLARDGLEVTPSGIVANRGSVPYDVYNFSGQMQQALFITATFRTAGIAFDGTNYIVSDVINGRLAVFNASGAFVRSVDLTGAAIPYGIVDLAAVSSQTMPSPALAGPHAANAASYASGAIAPGEIIAIFGSAVGPDTPIGLTSVDASGLVDTVLAGSRVLFDGVAAPVIFTTSKQINVITPYSVAAKSSVQVATEYLGVRSTAVSIPVAASAPGIFTADGSGTGQGAVLNEDGSVNSPANPARRGSIVVIYATGEGQTNPAGLDGKIAAGTLPAPVLPVTVTVNNEAAEVLYAGAASGLVAGVMQVNFRLPPNAPGGNIAILCRVGSAFSQAGVTIAIQ
jgi:uncharacterized protein (TIGR03437 family)